MPGLRYSRLWCGILLLAGTAQRPFTITSSAFKDGPCWRRDKLNGHVKGSTGIIGLFKNPL